jgi:hypothetical protein
MKSSSADLMSRPAYGVGFGLAVLFALGLASLAQTIRPAFADYRGPYLGQKPPGATAEIFAPGLLSDDDFPHGSPVFTPGGNEMILPGIKIMRNIEGRWTRPENAPFGGSLRGVNPTLSPDGMTLLFLSPYQGPERPATGTYVVARTGQTWGPAVLIDPAVNSLPRGWEISISSRGNLYFASGAIEGGFGSSDLYECELIAGKYSAPRNLGGGVNTRHNESSVYISPDEDYLVFSSTGPESLGSDDLYVSFRGQNGSWGRGINLGRQINSEGTETWPNVTTDGKYLFFIRAQGGRADIYWVSAKVLEALKPENPKQR